MPPGHVPIYFCVRFISMNITRILIFFVISQAWALESLYLSKVIRPNCEDCVILEMDASFAGSLLICKDTTLGVIGWIDVGQKGVISGRVMKRTDEWDKAFSNTVKLIKGTSKEERNNRGNDGYSVLLKDKDGIVELWCPDRREIVNSLIELCKLTDRKFSYSEIDGKISFHPGVYEK